MTIEPDGTDPSDAPALPRSAPSAEPAEADAALGADDIVDDGDTFDDDLVGEEGAEAVAVGPLRLEVAPEEVGARLDVWLAARVGVSRHQASLWIDQQRIELPQGRSARASYRMRAGDVVVASVDVPRPTALVAQDLPLTIVHQDAWVIVVDKAAGMVVHPAPGHPDGTLVNALLFHCPDLPGVGGEARPGIVHRIDRDTSGLLVVARTNEAHAWLGVQFARHTIHRRYLAIVVHLRGPALLDRGRIETGHHRHPTDRRRFTGSHGGRRAVSHYEVLERFNGGACLVALRLETGRTHQIRMHLSELGSPLLGDALYGAATADNRLIERHALHAAELGFTLPNRERLSFESPLPPDMASALQRLRAGEKWRG